MTSTLTISCNIVESTKLNQAPDISIAETYPTTNNIPVQITYSPDLDAPYAYSSDRDGDPVTYYFVEVPLSYFDIISRWKSENNNRYLQLVADENIKILSINFVEIS